ncbi:MAG: PAS domain S-box protein [Deltaproteobacteria bacterium]|nr:PAS domain S-box protein [Deltaproteobacteria bacterium]
MERPSKQGHFELIAHSARDIILVIAGDGRIVDCNGAAELAYRYPRHRLLELSITDLRAPSTMAIVQGQMLQASAQGILFETEHLRSDGSTFPCEVSSQGGEVDGKRVLVSIIRDISERRAAEIALRRSEESFRALIERSPDGVVVVREDRVVYANPSVLSALMFEPDAVLGRAPLDLVHPDDRAAAATRIRTLVAGGTTPDTRDLRFLRRDGAPVLMETQGLHLTYQGAPALMFLMREVTARRRAEEEVRHSQKMEAIGRLAGGVAHDFNNILTAILGHSELLCGALPAGGDALRQAEQIQRAATRAAQLTGQLLAFSRKQMLQPRVLGLARLIERLTIMLRRLIPEHIDLVTDLSAGRELYVRADPSQIEQVLVNLAVNGRDAMPGGGTLTIRLSPQLSPDAAGAGSGPPSIAGGFAVLEVSDTGPGMDEATRARAFEPFFSTKGKGTGLGLSIVYGIVTQSGGQVSIESPPGHGASFKMLLPLEPAPAAAIPVQQRESTPRGNETILLVEDDVDVRLFMVDVLTLQGYQVLAARDGAEALRIADTTTNPVDLLLTDVIMPRMSGTEVAARLRESRPRLRVLFVSGYPGETMIKQGVISSSLAFVQKPFTIAELTRRIRDVLDGPEPAL